MWVWWMMTNIVQVYMFSAGIKTDLWTFLNDQGWYCYYCYYYHWLCVFLGYSSVNTYNIYPNMCIIGATYVNSAPLTYVLLGGMHWHTFFKLHWKKCSWLCFSIQGSQKFFRMEVNRWYGVQLQMLGPYHIWDVYVGSISQHICFMWETNEVWTERIIFLFECVQLYRLTCWFGPDIKLDISKVQQNILLGPLLLE